MIRPRMPLSALAMLVLSGCGGSDGADSTVGPGAERFTATLTGAGVVPANASTNGGTITFESTPGDSVVTFSLSVVTMGGITQAHLHSAVTGANGATLAWLLPVNGNAAQSPSVTLEGTISLGSITPGWIRGNPRLAMDSVKTLMRAGRLYVDLHSSTFAAGELRGQVQPAP